MVVPTPKAHASAAPAHPAPGMAARNKTASAQCTPQATEDLSLANPLRLLLLLSESRHQTCVLDQLTRQLPQLEWRIIRHSKELRQALRTAVWDAVLSEPNLATLPALSALRHLHSQEFDLPFIVLHDETDEPLVAQLLQAGAHEAFHFAQLEHLLPAIQREVRYARHRADHRADHRAALAMLRESEARFRALAANLPGMVFELQRLPGHTLRFVYVNDGAIKLLGLTPAELMSAPHRFMAALEPNDRHSLEQAFDDSLSTGTTLNWEGRLHKRLHKRNQVKWINLRSTPQRLGDGALQWHGIITDISRSKEAEAKLRHSREQLSELSDHMEAAKEEERERIARDIHDELGSTLVALKIESSLLASKLPTSPPLLHDKARVIEQMLDQAMNTVSRVVRELRPGILKEFGLAAALESQAEDFSQRTGIVCRVRCDDDASELDEAASLALFRIFQEALTNVAKHAHASLVVVRLHRERHVIALEIRDNGRGISAADLNKPSSFGLRGIRERINSLGGEFNIAASEQGGCHMLLCVPQQRRVATPTVMPEDTLQGSLF